MASSEDFFCALAADQMRAFDELCEGKHARLSSDGGHGPCLAGHVGMEGTGVGVTMKKR